MSVGKAKQPLMRTLLKTLPAAEIVTTPSWQISNSPAEGWKETSEVQLHPEQIIFAGMEGEMPVPEKVTEPVKRSPLP